MVEETEALRGYRTYPSHTGSEWPTLGIMHNLLLFRSPSRCLESPGHGGLLFACDVT